MRCRTSDADKMKSVNTEHLEFEEKFEFLMKELYEDEYEDNYNNDRGI